MLFLYSIAPPVFVIKTIAQITYIQRKSFRQRFGCFLLFVCIVYVTSSVVLLNLLIPSGNRFRMRRTVFLPMMNDVEEHDDYFMQKRNATGVLGLSFGRRSLQLFVFS
jgi:hypothetical protein